MSVMFCSGTTTLMSAEKDVPCQTGAPSQDAHFEPYVAPSLFTRSPLSSWKLSAAAMASEDMHLQMRSSLTVVALRETTLREVSVEGRGGVAAHNPRRERAANAKNAACRAVYCGITHNGHFFEP